MKKLAVFLLGLLCLFYLLNPGAGLFELIPDHLPLIGNLDEAAAAAILLMCLNHFGIKLPGSGGRDNDPDLTGGSPGGS